jgi:streptogramin lyase
MIPLLIVAGLLSAPPAHAQSAHFSGSQSVVPTSSLNSPDGVAVDGTGNLYIADTWHQRVLKETLSGGIYTESIVDTNFSLPKALAVDGNSNVYVADISSSGINRVVKETFSNGSYSQSTIISGSFTPSGIAVDSNGSVYIAEDDHGLVLKETPSGNGYIQSTAVSGSLVPCGIAVDAIGNLYITDTFHSQLLKETLSGVSYTESVIGSGMNGPFGITLDQSGNIYVADNGNNRLLEETLSGSTYTQSVIISSGLNLPNEIAADASGALYIANQGTNQILKDSLSSTGFGTIDVGSPSATISLVFTFDTAGTISAPAVVTQGTAGLDFADARTGTCTTNGTGHTYNGGDNCTVNVTFTPKAPGPRYGAVELIDDSQIVIAHAYIQGTGSGPQVNFPPGTKSNVSLPNVTSPYAIAADAAGNLYIVQAEGVNSPNNAVIKETWNGSSYTPSVIVPSSVLLYPVAVAVDGFGNVFVADQHASSIIVASPERGGYTVSTQFSKVGNVEGVAVDGSGSVYFTSLALGVVKETYLNMQGYVQSTIAQSVIGSGIAVDAEGNVYVVDTPTHQVLKEAPSNGSYIQSTVGSGLGSPRRVAVDSIGNVYISDWGNSLILKETPAGGTYSQSVLSSGLNNPSALALDSAHNVYFLDAPNPGQALNIWRLNYANAPVLHFAATAVGSTSSDSPQSVMVENVGNATLNFPIPSQGANPSIPAGFTVSDSVPSACPLLNNSSSTEGTLAPNASCELSISFSPQSTTDSSNFLALTDNALNQTAPSYATQSIPLIVAGTQVTPPIVWATPADIPYGKTLSLIQLNATSSVAGTFGYSPSVGTKLKAGSHTLTATFTPSDTADFTTASANVTLVVDQLTPTIVWGTPRTITYGTALSATQLNAKASIPGTFSYSDPTGTVLSAGRHQLTVTFTPTDTTDYTTATATVTLFVYQVETTISWAKSTGITYGTPLSAVQLNATGSVPGNVTYSPAAGTVLSAGSHQIEATFTPTDSTDYTTAVSVITLYVSQATPTITWATPPGITYGTPLSAAQLNATASVPGSFSYTYSAGAILKAGTYQLMATFTPTDSRDYITMSRTVTLVVSQVAPRITWTTPAAITYGIPLGAAQLNASSTTPGTFSYSPASGTVLSAGSHTLTTTFTPSDATDYTRATASVTLVVNQTGTGVPGPLQFIPVTPCRVADTRNANGPFGGPEPNAKSTREFDIPSSACGIPSTALAYSLNVTVVPNGPLGYLSMWAAGQPQPLASTLNSIDGRVKANAAIVPAGTNGGVDVYVTDATNVILDIDGYFVPAGTSSALSFYPVAPCRVVDTRNAIGSLGGPSIGSKSSRNFPIQSSSCSIPSTAAAYSLNVTAVTKGPLGYLTIWPTGATQSLASTLNSYSGSVVANAAIVPAGTSGQVSVYVSDASDVVMDINGYFAPPASGGLSLYMVSPCRALDTRTAAGAFKGVLIAPVEGSTCAPPATAQAYVLNATVVPQVPLGYLTLWPDGGTQPLVSTLNSYDGSVTSNLAIVPTSDGRIDAYSTDPTNLILDISSFFAP